MQHCPVTARRRRRGLFNVLTFGLANRKELSFKDWCRQELREEEHGGLGQPNQGGVDILVDWAYRNAGYGGFGDLDEDVDTVLWGVAACVAGRLPKAQQSWFKEAEKVAMSQLTGQVDSDAEAVEWLIRLTWTRLTPAQRREATERCMGTKGQRAYAGGAFSGHRKDVGGYEVRKGHYIGEEVGRGRSRHRYAGNPLTSTRRRMPASDFALPISAQSAKFKASHPKNAGAYPMFDRAHASNARSRATQMLNSGWLTLKEAQTIYNRTSDRWGFAYKKLEHTPSGNWRSVKVRSKPRLRAAANKMYDINW